MRATPLHVPYVGGPTALLEWGGLRLLTDSTFDLAGSTYETPAYALRKVDDPVAGDRSTTTDTNQRRGGTMIDGWRRGDSRRRVERGASSSGVDA